MGKYTYKSVAAQIFHPEGPITETRYVVVTPGGTFLTLKNGGEVRLFKSLAAARAMAWRLNKTTKG